MNDVLADTHSIVWYLFDPARLSPAADAALTSAAQGGRLSISAITLVELNYLAGKKSFPYPHALSRIYALLADPLEPLKMLPLDVDVAKAMDRVPRVEVPDMPDRIVSATAVAYGLPIVSTDSNIRGSASLNALVRVVW